jgi:hypothetical protein
MNVLICIGVDTYKNLSLLQGAEKDAGNVFAQLCTSGEYDRDRSRLLLSPTSAEITQALHGAFAGRCEIEVFTFFFAGHGGVKDGSFFLCTRDSEGERLSTTALSIAGLFLILNEVRPSQANIIVDACQAGGSSFDLNQLIKPELVGTSSASSISFLGACTADQYAKETADGGLLTREFLKYLNGETEVQDRSPFLDLIEVGGLLCRVVNELDPSQRPISWGLSLFGQGRLARNPHFRAEGEERTFPLPAVSQQSVVGTLVRRHSSELWQEYRNIGSDFSARRLLDLLNVVGGKSDAISDMLSFVDGVTRAMTNRAQKSQELFAPILTHAAGLLFFLPRIDSELVRAYLRKSFEVLQKQMNETFNVMETSLTLDRGALLNRNNPLPDLYYLPLRITKILGWAGLSALLSKIFDPIGKAEPERFTFVSALLNMYPCAFAAVSDEQAPPLYIFLKTCQIFGKTEIAEAVLNRYFFSFAERKGKLARTESDGIRALKFICSLGPPEFRDAEWRPANPSIFLPVLLWFGRRFNLDSLWDLKSLDRLHTSFFIPEDYRNFGDKVIDGVNYNNQIGFGIWRLADFEREFNAAVVNHSHTFQLNDEGLILALIASLLFPDRLPLLLEVRENKA